MAAQAPQAAGVRRWVFRGLAVYLALFGLVISLFPFAVLMNPAGSMLFLDTRAYFASGSERPAPTVQTVNCSPQEFGTSVRNGPLRLWDCRLVLGSTPLTAPAAAASGPYAGMTSREASAEFQRALGALSKPAAPLQTGPSTLERQLPFDRSGEVPALRQMSPESEPLEYGVVWGGRELASRWSMWALVALLMVAFGGAAMYAARVSWAKGAVRA